VLKKPGLLKEPGFFSGYKGVFLLTAKTPRAPREERREGLTITE
jgi:hypothetical protein